ncbi:hypothetical protein BJX62DRAFT_239869 [Aspergillus germanicus]
MTVNYELEDCEMERIINDPGRAGPEQFLQISEREYYNHHGQTDHWFLLTGVTQRVFNEYFLEAESGPFSYAFAYDPYCHRLLVATPISTTHAVAGPAFNRMVDRAAEAIGMDNELVEMGRGCRMTEVGTKQPEMAWQPEEIVPGLVNRWPSVVLEVVYSKADPRPKLQADLRYWFRASPPGTVNTVFILTINRGKDEIVIEMWERIGADERPYLEQRAAISRTETGGDVMITGSPLIIGFENLFLRAPHRPNEVDVQLNDEKLQFIAERIWMRRDLNFQ